MAVNKDRTDLKIIQNWISLLKEKQFLFTLILTIVFITAILISLTNFLEYNETRGGFAFDDPFLSLFKPINLTWLTFSLIYGALIIGMIYFINNPPLLIIAFQSYGILVIFRMLAMYSLPLNPPEEMIMLEDPFVQLFGSGNVLLKDLFFSGHTSTLFLLFLVCKNRFLKTIFLSCTILVALCVILQHVHYTVDVLSAPFFSYGSFRIVYLFSSKFNQI